MQTVLRSDYQDQLVIAREDGRAPLGQLLERTLRRASLITLGGSRESPLRIDEQAADLALSAAADSDFMDDWTTLVAAVRHVVRAPTEHDEPLIVIPIDDPDLAPDQLKSVLLDLRLLTSLPGVVAIACLDLDETRAALKEAYLASFPRTADSRSLGGTVEAQLIKALPPNRRVEVHGLGSDQKLQFRPLDGNSASLEQLLSAYSVPSAEFGPVTVGSCLRMPLGGGPSPYAQSISSNPRDLVGLHQRLRAIAATDADEAVKASKSAAELCLHAFAYGGRRSGTLGAADRPVFEILDWAEPVVACRLSFDKVKFRGLTTTTVSEMRGTDRHFGRVQARFGQNQVTEATMPAGEKSEVLLDASLTHAMLMVREFSDAYEMLRCSIAGSVPTRGGDRVGDFLVLWLNEKRTDNRFLMVPPWEAYFDYFALDEAAVVLHAVTATTPAHYELKVRLEAYLIDFWRELLAVQRLRRGSEHIGATTKAIQGLNDESEQSTIIYRDADDLFAEIRATYASASSQSEVRASDFVQWFEVLVPHVLHPALVRPAFRRRVLDHRHSAVASCGRLASANAQLAASLERRVKASLDEVWVAPLIDLAEEFDAEMGAVLRASHRAALEQIQRARQRLLGESAVGGSMQGGGTGSSIGREDPDSDFRIVMDALGDLKREAQVAITERGR